jgi:tetratricopeptide (TPR) repeat protein
VSVGRTLRRGGGRRASVALAFVAALALAGPASASTIDGLRLYMQRHDDEGLAALARAQRAGGLEILGRLALADLYFMGGDRPQARRTLATLADDGFAPAEATVWLAWIDFAGGRRAQAARRLLTLAGGDADRVHALWSLGWQQLLDGRPSEAAQTFESLRSGDVPAEVAVQVPLLLGQSLLWAGRWDEAAAALARVEAGSLRGDAERDVAWIHYRQGDVERGRVELETLAARGDPGPSRLRVPWPSVLRHGPRRLARAWLDAYKKRPRGQDPSQFVLTLADRDAAADARAMLSAIEREERGVDGRGRFPRGMAPPEVEPRVAALATGGAVPRAERGDGPSPSREGDDAASWRSRLIVWLALLVAAGWYVLRRSQRSR